MSSTHPLKRWNHTLPPRNTRPHAACPYCYADTTSTDPGTLLEFRCPRGHTFIQTRTQALQHAEWLTRYFTGPMENR